MRLLVILWLMGQAHSQGVFNVAVQGILGPGFQETLGPYLSQETGYVFNPITYNNDTQMLLDSAKGLLNLTFVGPVQYLCLALFGTTSDGVAELVSASYIDNSPVELIAGAIIVRTDSNISSIQDLKGKVVLTGPISSLVSFAAQWQTLKVAGFDLFLDTGGVYLKYNITQILPDLIGGVGDVAFVPASFLERYYPNTSYFTAVVPRFDAGFPYVHSTPLYPNVLLSALDSTDFLIRKTIAQALLAIQPNNSAAITGEYYGFTSLGAYTVVRTLLASLGLLNNATQCRTINSLADVIQCPLGYHTRAEQAVCTNRPCPNGYQCVCSPCEANVETKRIAGLSVPAFATVTAVVLMFIVVVLFVVIRLCFISTLTDPLTNVDLGTAVVIGQSTAGPVFATELNGQAVAVKKLVSNTHTLGRLKMITQLIGECFWISNPPVRSAARLRRTMDLHHANIMPILGISRGRFRQDTLAVMPRMTAGTLADLLASQTCPLDTLKIVSIALDVTNAQIFLHHHGQTGTNMKPQHLFLDQNLRILLGVSFRSPNHQSLWAPPEALRDPQAPWTQAADVYAFSMLLYTLLHRRAPFQDRPDDEVQAAIRDADETSLHDARPVSEVSGPVNDLMQECWSEQPSLRPTFADIRVTLMEIAASTGDIQKNLLHGMFPDHVLRLLQQGAPVPTENFPDVTIFFSDIVDFTHHSSSLPPQLVQNFLDRLYRLLDNLSDKWHVHKMETIGDAFVAVTNLMSHQPDHAARMAKFALEVMAAASTIPVDEAKPDGLKLSLRIGLHSGEVVAGVAGTKNLRYCLFGHTMNIASRMESEGKPGHIHMSRTTAQLISQDHNLRPRLQHRPGYINVKGQGPMKTAWLLTE